MGICQSIRATLAYDATRTSWIKNEKAALTHTRILVLETLSMFQTIKCEPSGSRYRKNLLDGVLVWAETLYIRSATTLTTSQMRGQARRSVLNVLSSYVGIPPSSMTAIPNAASLWAFVQVTDDTLASLTACDKSLALRHAP